MVAADADTENWFLLMDPAWQPEREDEAPPVRAVVGLWPVDPDGVVGRFRTNPSYEPSDPDSPSDPLDAVLRLLMRGEAESDQLRLLLRDSLFDLAMNGDGRPLVMRSPDDVPCVVVATSEPHRRRVSSPDWRRLDLADLVDLLADDLDVLINPGGPAAVRLLGDFMRRTRVMSEEDVAAAYERFRDGRTLEVVPWEVPPEPNAEWPSEGSAEGAAEGSADGEAPVEEHPAGEGEPAAHPAAGAVVEAPTAVGVGDVDLTTAVEPGVPAGQRPSSES
ncbi:type VII secretion system-associated protein [Actinosynnema sp. NPDC053489]|uniref:type VII secretion system-associated protein n=1 Tax=Actinosynnema sp. NPDC053489 TaxID=3363916 RepID=UPI0037C9A962